jgi:hypothetical protein
MKIIFSALLSFCLASNAFAQTPVPKEQANAYFASCVKQPPAPPLSAQTQEMLCAPCMDGPAYDFHYNACITNPQASRYGNPQVACECMARQVADHMKSNGPAIFRDILAKNPTLMDPMSALADDPSFTQFAQSKLLSCIGR